MDFHTALNVVYSAIDVVNSSRRPSEGMIALSPNVILVGEGGYLDSLALAILVLAVERQVAELTGQEVQLLDGGEFDSKLSAFRTPSTLSELIIEKIEDD